MSRNLPAFLSIDEISRDTGLGKDQLRAWERRYGFPEPARNSQGQRQYSWQQLECLRRISRMIDQGHRPGNLLKKGICEKLLIEDSHPVVEPQLPYLDHWVSMDHQQLMIELNDRFSSQPLSDVIETLVEPLISMLGQSWSAGRLDIHQEHRISHCLKVLLSQHILQLPSQSSMPCLLFSTIPGERHTLGLLMAEYRMREAGCRSIHLGSELPLDELARAAVAYRADAMVLSFSPLLSRRNILDSLQQLNQLAPDTQIIAGGSGIKSLRRLPEWLQVIRNDRELNLLLKTWKAQSHH